MIGAVPGGSFVLSLLTGSAARPGTPSTVPSSSASKPCESHALRYIDFSLTAHHQVSQLRAARRERPFSIRQGDLVSNPIVERAHPFNAQTKQKFQIVRRNPATRRSHPQNFHQGRRGGTVAGAAGLAGPAHTSPLPSGSSSSG